MPIIIPSKNQNVAIADVVCKCQQNYSLVVLLSRDLFLVSSIILIILLTDMGSYRQRPHLTKGTAQIFKVLFFCSIGVAAIFE